MFKLYLSLCKSIGFHCNCLTFAHFTNWEKRQLSVFCVVPSIEFNMYWTQFTPLTLWRKVDCYLDVKHYFHCQDNRLQLNLFVKTSWNFSWSTIQHPTLFKTCFLSHGCCCCCLNMTLNCISPTQIGQYEWESNYSLNAHAITSNSFTTHTRTSLNIQTRSSRSLLRKMAR